MEVIDLPIIGNQFTWFSSDGKPKNRDVSDHCPISIKGRQLNWGPTPFRSNNCWFENKHFLTLGKNSGNHTI
ncbi:unnamed protein product [Lathyrus sativus]|nr:unnamed protein product [Lathyrus sativus]